MANVLHRTTKKYIQSVNTPDYPIEDWIINPDLSAVTGFESKYWIITGDTVTLMGAAARDALDAAELETTKDAIVNQIDNLNDIIRALASVLVDELNILRTQHSLPNRTLAQLKTAIRNKLGT